MYDIHYNSSNSLFNPEKKKLKEEQLLVCFKYSERAEHLEWPKQVTVTVAPHQQHLLTAGQLQNIYKEKRKTSQVWLFLQLILYLELMTL